MESKHSILKSFQFAFEGIKVAIQKGRNFRIQIIFGMLSLFLGFIFKISSSEWIALIFIVALVLILELINTAIESIVDLVSPEIHPKAKIAKDVAAAAVLVASISAVVIGAFIFFQNILGGLLNQ